MAQKAKKLFTEYGKHSNIVTYEYRGRTYDVEYAKDWMYCATPAHIQHKDKQDQIDAEIEAESKPHNGNPVDWNEIFELLGWEY